MNRKNAFLTGVIVLALVVLTVVATGCEKQAVTAPASADNAAQDASKPAEKVKLTYATHWITYQINGIVENDSQGNPVLISKGLQQYVDEYNALNPNVEVEILQVPYVEYADKMNLMYDAGVAPDIYQIYSTWGVSYQKEGMLDPLPADILADIKANYVSSSGAVIDGELRAIPSEVNDHAMLYNKEIFKKAGIVDADGNAKPPTTWAELADYAKKTTIKDANGNIEQYGIAFYKGIDGYVVDPFLSLLFSNGGKFLSDDEKKCMLNNEAGVETLTAMTDLFKSGSTDFTGTLWDFGKGKVAMVIVAPWTEGNYRQALGSDFEKVVGIAPVPKMKKSASLQYSWILGVMSSSPHKQEAWDFLRWFTSEVQPDRGTTRYGDLLARTIGAIPSRKIDLDGNKDKMGDSFFKKTFVEEIPNSVAEPNVMNSAKIKEIMRIEIEASWAGEKTPKEALDSACEKIDQLLQ
ncbi:ABC transporter substrate-binding protein [Candidatus Woesearchaeota archaeon]|nr:ABC transporter substrate-binding protein [Candidatus Woesearchaeota archaeon]